MAGMILAIDPGPATSAMVGWNGSKIVLAFDYSNDVLLKYLCNPQLPDCPLVIEWITGFGIPAGASIFDTCRWIGRFQQVYETPHAPVHLLSRQKIKQHLRAVNDKFVKEALESRFGPAGTKKNPGLMYGITGHLRAAFACAVTFWDLNMGLNPGRHERLPDRERGDEDGG